MNAQTRRGRESPERHQRRTKQRRDSYRLQNRAQDKGRTHHSHSWGTRKSSISYDEYGGGIPPSRNPWMPLGDAPGRYHQFDKQKQKRFNQSRAENNVALVRGEECKAYISNRQQSNSYHQHPPKNCSAAVVRQMGTIPRVTFGKKKFFLS